MEEKIDRDLKKFDPAVPDKPGDKAVPKELLESVTGGEDDYPVPYQCPNCHVNLWCHVVKNIGYRYYCKTCDYYYVFY